MDWMDTLFLEPNGPDGNYRVYQEVVKASQITPVHGVSLLHIPVSNHEEAHAALKTLERFRAVRRRVVLCDTSTLLSEGCRFAERQLGHAVVETGHAELLVTSGPGGREVGIGARDRGMELANVVVCGEAQSACEVLSHRLSPGDTVLLLATDKETRARLVLSLEKRLSRPAIAA